VDQSLHITADAEFESESVDGCGLKIRRSTRLCYWAKLRNRRAQMDSFRASFWFETATICFSSHINFNV